MKLLDVLRTRRYLLIAVFSSMAFTSVYVYTQVLGIIENLDLWLTVIPWYNAVLFIMFVTLFGATVSFQIYSRQQKTCSVNGKTAGASSSATILGMFVAQCPACASLGALLLPASIFTVFVKYSTLMNLVSIGILVVALHYLGAFRKS